MLEALLVRAPGAHEVEVSRFIHLLPFVILRQLALQFIKESLVEDVLERDGVEGEAFRVPLVLHLLKELVEEVVRAAMGREDFQLAAPGNTGICDGVELARVGVQGELVEDAVTTLARLGIGITGERMRPEAIVEPEDVGRVALLIDDLLAEILGTRLQDIGKAFEVFQEEAGLHVITGGDPRVEAGVFLGLAPDDAVGARPGPTDLAGLLGNLQPRAILDPCRLIRQEHGVGGWFDFGVSHGVNVFC